MSTTSSEETAVGGDDDGGVGADDGGGMGGDDCGIAPVSTNPGTISLASTMSKDSLISETPASESLAQIGKGDGRPGDRDGLWWLQDPNVPVGSGMDIFPHEENFRIGSLTYDREQVTRCGVHTVTIDGIDLSSLWAPNSSTTDINDATGLDLWLPGSELLSFTFEAPAEGDTLTFTDGVLTSIDLVLPSTATMAYGEEPNEIAVHDGEFRISGSDLTWAISEVVFVFIPGLNESLDTQVVVDMAGVVNAVQP
ncbi:MAG: hypothetical protein AAGA56_09270 [Myxococcota bacterium]